MTAKKVSHDDIDRLFEYDFYLPTRTIYMGSCATDWDGNETGVDFAMAERMIKALHIMDRAAKNGDQPITILMNNVGGDFYHGCAIYDAIQACSNHVTIKATGYAMSMGSIIFQAADERVMTPLAKMMIHHGTSGYTGHPKIVKAWSREDEKLSRWMVEMYLAKIQAKRPEMTYEAVDRLCDFDTFYSAQEAVDMGLADRIDYGFAI